MSKNRDQQFADDGYCVVEKAFTLDEVEALRQEAVAVCLRRRGPISRGEGLECRTVEDVNKHAIAVHFPHKVSRLYRACLAHDALTGWLTRIIGPNVKCMQSMIFMKSAGMPGQAWHQDESFIPTTDQSLVGAWIALDRATVENGCMWVLPGSHKPATLWAMRPHQDARFDDAPESYGFPYHESQAVPVEVDAGNVIFFHGYLLHRSLPNTCATGYRRSFVNHYMSAESPLAWSGGIPENHRDDYRDIVLIAGVDPYPERGTENLSAPYYRARP